MEETLRQLQFRYELQQLLNRYSAENGSNTPDFVLAEYLIACLAAFDKATGLRDSFYGIAPRPGRRLEVNAPESPR